MKAQGGNQALIRIVRERISREGPVSFAWFMEQALYHPALGYYASDRCAIGREGDYFTNVSVGPIFGRLLAVQFVEMWEQLGRPRDFVIVEQGAHHGEFARDVLEALKELAPQFLAGLRYRIVEPFSVLRERQEKVLSEFGGQVEWSESVETLEPFRGVYFGNELLDALPAHLVVSRGDKESSWLEKRVGLAEDQFVFVEQPITDARLAERVRSLPARVAGYMTEINLAAPELLARVAARLLQGFILTIDYGFSRAELLAEHRTAGTLQVRAGHRRLDSVFEAIGESDLTAHVDWTSLAEKAKAVGLRNAGFTDQHHFLTGILAASPEVAERGSAKERRALQTLLHPEIMGRCFQCLALSKGVEATPGLSGFKFARPPETALGL